MDTGNTSWFLLRISAEDNVFVLVKSLAAGEGLVIDGHRTTLAAPLALGHKIAARGIAAGEHIVKYGAPIGSATTAIRQGEPVHLHNMKSDYLPTYTLEEGRTFEH
jgi:altronate dehydratase small subunit